MSDLAAFITSNASGIAKTALAIKLTETTCRWAIIASLKMFGAWDPRWEARIPRILPWRWFWRGYLFYKEWYEEHFGLGKDNAALAGSLTQLSHQFKDGDSLLGRVRLPYGLPCPVLSGEPIETHKLVLGQSGAGKSVTEQTQLGLISDRATCAISDPTGQHTHNILYALEDRGHKLVVIDPLNSLPRSSGTLELFANIHELNRRMGDDFSTVLLDKFAAAIFPEDASNNKFFVLTPRQLWARLMRFAMTFGPDATVLEAHRLLNRGFFEEADGDARLAMTMLWVAMSKHTEDYVSEAGIAMLDLDEKTRSNILATTRSRTEFWGHKQIQNVSRSNDAFISDLKPEPGNDDGLIISFVIPVGLANTTFKPYLAQWFSLIFFMFEAIPGDLSPKCRIVIEEMQSFAGSIDGIQTVVPLLRSRGCSFTGITQNPSGLNEAIGANNAESMISSSAHVQFVGLNDVRMRGLIQSMALGNRTIRKRKWGFLWVKSTKTKPVLTDDQLRRVMSPKRQQIFVHRANSRPMILRQAPGYKELPVWLCYPDRDHGETAARALFRKVYVWWTGRRTAQVRSEPLALLTRPPDTRKLEMLASASQSRRTASSASAGATRR